MALTNDNFVKTVFGNKKVRVFDTDFDSSYPTGGEALSAADMGLRKAELVVANPKNGYTFSYDYANGKLLAYQGDNANAAAAPSVQVANTTDLSAVTNVRVLAIGY